MKLFTSTLSIACAAMALVPYAGSAQTNIRITPDTVWVQAGEAGVQVGPTAPLMSTKSFPSLRSLTSFQAQQTALTLNARNLKQPHVLRLKSTGSAFAGTITVNGKVVKTLSTPQDSVDLSRYLAVGQNRVTISATLASGSSQLDLSGPGVSVMQQSSGNGSLNSILNIAVR